MGEANDALGDGGVNDFIAHFGVIGMKWGARKARKAVTSTDASKSIKVRDKAKSHTVKALSNAQLKTAIERMNLEQTFKRSANNEKSAVGRFVANTLADIGKREIQTALAKKVAGFGVKKVVTGGLG